MAQFRPQKPKKWWRFALEVRDVTGDQTMKNDLTEHQQADVEALMNELLSIISPARPVDKIIVHVGDETEIRIS